MKPKSAKSLSHFLATITESLSALKTLDCQTHHWDPLLLHLLVRLLDTKTREAWEVKLGSSSVYPTYIQFEEFLTSRTRAMESLEINNGNNVFPEFENKIRTTSRSDFQVKFHFATSINSEINSSCPLCQSNHYLINCPKYINNTSQNRREIISKKRICYNCLGPHLLKRCISNYRCRKCGRKHHTTLHSEFSNQIQSTTTLDLNKKTKSSTTEPQTTDHSI